MRQHEVVLERATRGDAAFAPDVPDLPDLWDQPAVPAVPDLPDVPDQPACAATERALEVVELRIREGIMLHMDGILEARISVSEPSSWTWAVEGRLD